jgi:hypothetical protein
MKNIFKIFILSIAGAIIFSSCEEDNFDFGNGAIPGANMYPVSDITYLAGISTGIDVSLSPFLNDGVTLSGINVTKQLFTAGGDSDPVNYSIPGPNFTQTVAELYADVPVAGSASNDLTMVPGDSWVISYSMSLADGRTMVIGQKTTVTFLCPPYPGDWSVVMHDSYGDGWQTNDGSGGDGIQVTLDDGTVLEVGLCNPYVASGFDCTPTNAAGTDGTGTVTIPTGTITASWNFPGDQYGEISFEIYGPDGTQVYVSPQGAAGGILPIVLCAP